MTSRDFCFWLQGFFEIAQPMQLGPNEIELIEKHLAMVFIHEIDPSMPSPKLDKIHAQQINPATAIMRC